VVPRGRGLIGYLQEEEEKDADRDADTGGAPQEGPDHEQKEGRDKPAEDLERLDLRGALALKEWAPAEQAAIEASGARLQPRL